MTGAGRPNINDVAAEAGVSRASASRALGGYGYTSKEIQERVLAAAEQLNYQPSRIARTMRNGKSDTIGFVCADISLDFFSSAMRGICDVANREDCQVIVTNSDDRLKQEQSATTTLMSHGIDGLVISPISVRRHAHIDAVLASGTPVVSLDRKLTTSGVDSVVADNEEAAAKAVRHLIQLGHRRIGFLVSVQPEEPPKLRLDGSGASVRGPSRPSRDRTRGYLRGLAEAQLAVDPDLVAFVPHDEPERRRTAVLRMLQTGAPTALFTGDSYLTKSAFSVLAEEGLRVPDEISLLGFDDQEWTTLVTPQVSVVVQSAYEMGRVAAERLMARIRGNKDAVSDLTVATRYLERDSVAGPGTAKRRASIPTPSSARSGALDLA